MLMHQLDQQKHSRNLKIKLVLSAKDATLCREAHFADKDGLWNIKTLVIPVCSGGGVDGVPGAAAAHLPSQPGLPGTSGCWSQFSTLPQAQSICWCFTHTTQRRGGRWRWGVGTRGGKVHWEEEENQKHQGTGKERKEEGQKKQNPKINQNRGGGQEETEITQQECAVMICCMQIATSVRVAAFLLS